MLVNARLSYISVDCLHYNPGGQVILTVNPLASLHFLTDPELHLATETEQGRMRLLIQSVPKIVTRVTSLLSQSACVF